MYPITLKDLLSVIGDHVHVNIEYLESKYPIDANLPFTEHIISSSTIDFYTCDDMKFPSWMLTCYIQYIVVDPDRSLRIYLYGIK